MLFILKVPLYLTFEAFSSQIILSVQIFLILSKTG